MTDNEKLARWQGLDSHTCDENAFHCDGCQRGSIQTPDYLNDDAAAMSLLDTLVEKKYHPVLRTSDATEGWRLAIYDDYCNAQIVEITGKPTRREAVVAACLEVARKEDAPMSAAMIIENEVLDAT